MAKKIFNVVSQSLSDSDFRIWGGRLSDALTEIGFAKTADTGQIDWATATRVTVANTYAGYEIRAFSDDLQATVPVYLKIEYGAGSNAAYIGMRITMGRATDGAGTLLGEVAGPLLIDPSGNSTAYYPCVVSGGTDRIEVGMLMTATSYSFCFWVERVKDNSGNPTDIGVDLGGMSRSSSYQQMLPKKGMAYPVTVPMTSGIIMSALPNNTIKLSYAGNLGFYPIYSNMGYAANPSLAACFYATASIGSVGSIITVSIYGQNHDYIIGGFPINMTNGNNLGISLALRYE
jgi:hypothetical protein